MYLIGDSIAASISHELAVKIEAGNTLVNYTRGGIGIKQADEMFMEKVTKQQQHTAVIIVGTNDLFQTPWNEMKVAFTSLLNKLKYCKSVFLIQILKRYDVPKVNKHIT